MILRLFRLYQPFTVFLILLMAAALWMYSFLHTNTILVQLPDSLMPLYKWVNSLVGENKFLNTFLAFTLLTIEALLLSRLNKKFIFINARTYLPSIIFVLISFGFLPLHALHPVHFGILFLLLSINSLLKTYRREQLTYGIFEAAFALSIGSFFYGKLLFFIVFIWIGIIILRPLYWREWFYSIIGIVLPYLFLFTYYYVFQDEPGKLINILTENLFGPRISYTFQLHELIFLAYLLLLIIVSSLFMLQVFRIKKIHSRKFFSLFFWLFLCAVAIYYIIPSTSFYIYFIAAVPVSILLGHYFAITKQKKVANFFLLLLLFIIVFLQLSYIYGVLT
ncbi:MAG: hypothetical protein ACOCUL_04850 [Bacteroidota bacterium]